MVQSGSAAAVALPAVVPASATRRPASTAPARSRQAEGGQHGGKADQHPALENCRWRRRVRSIVCTSNPILWRGGSMPRSYRTPWVNSPSPHFLTCSDSWDRRRPSGTTQLMFCVGSLMSQVLQWTQFCALICSRGAPARVAGQSHKRRPDNSAAPARRRAARLIAIGMVGIPQLQMRRLVLLVIGVRDEHRG